MLLLHAADMEPLRMLLTWTLVHDTTRKTLHQRVVMCTARRPKRSFSCTAWGALFNLI